MPLWFKLMAQNGQLNRNAPMFAMLLGLILRDLLILSHVMWQHLKNAISTSLMVPRQKFFIQFLSIRT